MTELIHDLARTMGEPRHWSDERIETATRELLAQHPEEDDHLLDQETRALVQKCRTIMKRRDNEPTLLRNEK